MTTRAQRQRLISVEDVEARFDNASVRATWCKAHSKQPLPADFSQHVRSCVRAYLEWASMPSAGEMGLELRRLYDRLIIAVELRDRERAARALEQTPEDVLSEMKRRFPGQIPSLADIRRMPVRHLSQRLRLSTPHDGIDVAKEFLGHCVSGAEV